MNIVIITGASSGMGKEFALQLDAGLYTVDEFWLVARRKDRLEELAAQLDHMAKVIPADLTCEEDMEKFRKLLKEERPVIRMLINSSGYGIMGRFTEMERQERLGMVDVNCRALTDMTCACIPYMKKNSRLIMMASSAAFLPQPGFAVYAATKSYVLSLSRALREELREKGIYVTAVCPGPVRTEFFDRAEKYAATLAVKKFSCVEPEDVVRAALTASARNRAMSVYSPLMKGFHLLSKTLPHSLLLEIAQKLK